VTYAQLWPILVVTAAITFVVFDLFAGFVWSLLAHDVVSAALAALVTIPASYYFEGMVARVVADQRCAGHLPSRWRVVTAVPAIRLLLVDVLATAVCCLGLALAIVPGLLAFAVTAVVAPVLVIENLSVLAAFRRSYELVSTSFAQVLFLSMILLLVTIALTAAVIAGGGALGGGSIWGYWVSALLANVAIAPFAALCAVTMYFDLSAATNRAAARDG
jgi:hypothetical protein